MNYKINGETGLYCLLGHPVSHSISPELHNAAFKELNLPYVYMAFDVMPEDLETAVKGLKTMGVRGFNLTMPHKKAIIPLLDELEGAAKLCKAVNTVKNLDGRLTGYSTDGIGYTESLRKHGVDPKGKNIVILGAGGAAESIIAELALEGASAITVFKRSNATFEKTKQYVESIEIETKVPIEAVAMDDKYALKDAVGHADILCNATNVGMGDDENSLIAREYLKKGLFVSDIIYHPEKTTLLKYAEEVGCPYMNGKDMLILQGAAAFNIWTGKDMPISAINI